MNTVGIRDGKDTSEFGVAQKATGAVKTYLILGMVIQTCGILAGVVPALREITGLPAWVAPLVGVVLGLIPQVAAIWRAALVEAGYIASRATLKVEAIRKMPPLILLAGILLLGGCSFPTQPTPSKAASAVGAQDKKEVVLSAWEQCDKADKEIVADLENVARAAWLNYREQFLIANTDAQGKVTLSTLQTWAEEQEKFDADLADAHAKIDLNQRQRAALRYASAEQNQVMPANGATVGMAGALGFLLGHLLFGG